MPVFAGSLLQEVLRSRLRGHFPLPVESESRGHEELMDRVEETK
jgi:hypothetical protein